MNRQMAPTPNERTNERTGTLICGRAFFKPFGSAAYNFRRWLRARPSRVFLPSVYFLNGRNNKPGRVTTSLFAYYAPTFSCAGETARRETSPVKIGILGPKNLSPPPPPSPVFSTSTLRNCSNRHPPPVSRCRVSPKRGDDDCSPVSDEESSVGSIRHVSRENVYPSPSPFLSIDEKRKIGVSSPPVSIPIFEIRSDVRRPRFASASPLPGFTRIALNNAWNARTEEEEGGGRCRSPDRKHR